MQTSLNGKTLIKILNQSDFSRRFGRIISVHNLPGGANSRTYRIKSETGEMYICKHYYPQNTGVSDRLRREFGGLRYVNKQMPGLVPEAVFRDDGHNLAVYENISGRPYRTGEITLSDINQLVKLFRFLKSVTNTAGVSNFKPAKDACFCISDIYKSIDDRLNRLSKNSNRGINKKLNRFLYAEFLPVYTEMKNDTGNIYKQQGVRIINKLSRKYRILSPSDFGFHNAIRTGSGKPVFVDFEYFGFDDPVKAVSDFLLHPKNRIGNALKQKFIDGMKEICRDDADFAVRLKIVYGFYALKWCMIALNEFNRSDYERRIFAGGKSGQREKILTQQLIKAQKFLKTARNGFRKFPYAV